MVFEGGYTHGGDIYENRIRLDFSANVNPYGTPRAVKEAVASSAADIAVYPDPYCGPLRCAIAEKLGTDRKDIICGNGAAELIYQFASALGPAKALLPVPTFSDYEEALVSSGAEIEHFPLLREDGFRVTERILSAITDKTDLIVLVNPNNPTGLAIDRALLRRILARCRRTGTWLFLDECFTDLTDEDKADTLLPELKGGDRVFLLRAFTKTYGMAGVRLGYGISKDREMLRRMSALSQSWNVSAPAQAAGIAALSCDGWAQKARALFAKEKPYLIRSLTKAHLTVLPGDANFLFISGPADLGKALLEKGVLIRDCRNYAGLAAGDFRIAVRTHRENRELVNAIREVMDGRNGD